MRYLPLITAFCAMVTFPALAETNDPVFLLEPNESLLHISATEQREVDQDLLIANLQIRAEHAQSASVQDKVNTQMAEALKLAEKYEDVKAVTRGYNVYQYDRNSGKKERPRAMIWRGQQSLQLKSKNAEELLDLAGKVQELGFHMKGLNYTLSPEMAAQVRDEMLEAALEKLQNRASRAAKSLGKSKAELKEINTNGQDGPRPLMHARAEAMSMDSSAKMAAPVASPGETTLTMSVSARAVLSP